MAGRTVIEREGEESGLLFLAWAGIAMGGSWVSDVSAEKNMNGLFLLVFLFFSQ